MTDNSEAKAVSLIIGAHRLIINETPAILSLLYDLNLLPEQVATYRNAMLMAGICKAFSLGHQKAVAQ
jgi:hypothetical protein